MDFVHFPWAFHLSIPSLMSQSHWASPSRVFPLRHSHQNPPLSVTVEDLHICPLLLQVFSHHSILHLSHFMLTIPVNLPLKLYYLKKESLNPKLVTLFSILKEVIFQRLFYSWIYPWKLFLGRKFRIPFLLPVYSHLIEFSNSANQSILSKN